MNPKNIDGSVAVVLPSTGGASHVPVSIPRFTPQEVGARVNDWDRHYDIEAVTWTCCDRFHRQALDQALW